MNENRENQNAWLNRLFELEERRGKVPFTIEEKREYYQLRAKYNSLLDKTNKAFEQNKDLPLQTPPLKDFLPDPKLPSIDQSPNLSSDTLSRTNPDPNSVRLSTPTSLSSTPITPSPPPPAPNTGSSGGGPNWPIALYRPPPPPPTAPSPPSPSNGSSGDGGGIGPGQKIPYADDVQMVEIVAPLPVPVTIVDGKTVGGPNQQTPSNKGQFGSPSDQYARRINERITQVTGGIFQAAGSDRAEDIFGGTQKTLGGMLGPIGEFGNVLADVVKKMRDWGEALYNNNARFAEFSSAMAAVVTRQRVREIELAIERGERRAPGAEAQAQAKYEFDREIAIWEDAWQQEMTRLNIEQLKIQTEILKKIREWLGIKDEKGNTETFGQFVLGLGQDIAKKYGRPQRRP